MWVKFMFLVLIGLLPGISFAATVGLSDVIKTLETPFKETPVKGTGIYDFQAEFFQESYLADIDRAQRGRGEVSFKFQQPKTENAPLAMFRWEYREPTIQEIISDGRTMWVYQPENRQVIESDISHFDQQRSDNPVTFLSGLGNLSRDFYVRWGTPDTDSEGNHILQLQPRRSSQLIQTLEIVVDRKAVHDYVENNRTGTYFPILATIVTDPNGNRTSIKFNSIKVNQKLSKGSFHFDRPDGVEVLRPEDVYPGF